MASRATLPDQRRQMDNPKADRAEIARGISLLFEPGDVVEVRIPKTRAGVVAGYFDDHTMLATAMHDADTKYRAGGVYYVVNRINPALLGRAYNRLKERAAVRYKSEDITAWLNSRPTGGDQSNARA
jgi:hypothetical protein